MGLSLEKKSELVRLSLAKRQVPTDIKVAVKLALDVSGSTQHFFRDGTMEELVDRLIPVGMRFDDDGSIESYAFSTRVSGPIGLSASDFGRATDKIARDAGSSVMWGGTRYSVALQAILDGINPKRTFGQMFGLGKKPEIKPSYVKFITDGDNERYDEDAAESLLQKLGQFKCYVQLIGIGRGSRTDFGWLRDMADAYGHVGFVTFPDLETTSDQAMYEALLGDEFCGWIKAQ